MVYEQRIQRTNSAAIEVDGVSKRFADLWALRDVSFTVAPGKVLGLLGHNGAGKTTMVRILTTSCAPSLGRASVAGHDVVREPARVREKIGVAAQAATVDGLLSAHANLVMIGRLYHLDKAEARRRADALLERLELSDARDRLAKQLSGGMRRRLDLAASLIARPPVLFLDEPTTGLDPHSRNELWSLLREHVREGATLVLTTQYLEEADRLADDVIVLDKGQIAAHGTPAQLKDRIGGERVVVTVRDARELPAARAVLQSFADGEPTLDAEALHAEAPIRSGTRLVEIVRALDAAGIDAHDVSRREVTLDDVFLALTASGRKAAQPPKDAA
jgi:ABC-2 type transport system ATP-binding protein